MAVAVAVGTAIGSAFAAVKMRRARNGSITKADLLQMQRTIEEGAKQDRHEMYNKIQANNAGLELDIQGLSANISEYVKSNETRMRELEKQHGDRIREVERELDRRGGGGRQK